MQRRTMLLSAAVMAALGSASPLALAADQTMNVDVCIVGAGAGGVSAGMASVDAGFKTVILEKLGVIGGGGNYMEGTFAVGSRLQLKDNVGINVEKQFKRVMDFHHWRINGKALNNWLKQTAATIDWMEQHGIKFEGVHTAFIDGNRTWHMFEGGHGSSLIKNFAQKIEAKGGQILTSTPAQSLIIDKNGTVTGVIAQNEDGDKITINAKAVIIATGGFSCNPEMVKKYLPYAGYESAGSPGRTGDGINMARLVGAHVAGMHAVAGNAPYLPDVPPINQFSGPDELKQGRCALAQPWLWVDHTGRRFFNESRGSVFVDVYNAMTTAGGVSYTIFDQEKMDRMIQKGAVLPFNAIVLAETPLKALPKTWEIGQQRGWAFKADTIEELAMQIGVPPKNLRETMQKVNSYAETGVDPEFGRKKEHLVKFNLEKGPYYALKAIRAFFLTLGGVTVTPNFEAKNPQGDVIRNLYVIGQDIGGLYDSSYDLRCEGSASSFAMTSGRVAALHALKAIEAGE